MLECAADDLREMLAQKIGVAHPAINVLRGVPERAQYKTRIENAPRDYHVDALPYPAFQLEISRFSYGSIRERRSLAPLQDRSLIRNSHPQSDAPRGFKRFLPLEQSE